MAYSPPSRTGEGSGGGDYLTDKDRAMTLQTATPVTRPGSNDVTIAAERLTKIYRVQKKPPGLLASVRAVFQREYTDVRAVDGVSLTIKRGELVGFLGPNGA